MNDSSEFAFLQLSGSEFNRAGACIGEGSVSCYYEIAKNLFTSVHSCVITIQPMQLKIIFKWLVNSLETLLLFLMVY